MGQAKERKKAGLGPLSKPVATIVSQPKLPQYTAEKVIRMFTSKAIKLAGETVVPLGDEIGFLTYSDTDGGTAYLVEQNSYKKLASFPAVITDEMRQSKCASPDCDCGNDKWDDLLHGCTSEQHEDFDEDYLVPVKLYAALCKNKECTEQHVWILSECIDGHAHYNNHFQLL